MLENFGMGQEHRESMWGVKHQRKIRKLMKTEGQGEGSDGREHSMMIS